MQGYILNVNRVKDEDLIVTIISSQSLDTLYRFYGARHSVINLGFKVDYERETMSKSSISRLRDVIHLGFPWIGDFKHLKLWQEFIRLFYRHLKDIENPDSFYFELIDKASIQWNKQNPKRVAIESYIRLLEFEGRRHSLESCYLCSEPIHEKITLIRAFLPTHPECSHYKAFSYKGVDELLGSGSSLFLDDSEIERLWNTLCEGL